MALIAIINALLWRLGGAGALPFKRNWRRLIYPTLVLVFSLIAGFGAIRAILCVLVCHLTTRLPLTLEDNDMDTVLEYLWIWVHGYILGLPAVILYGPIGFLYALVPMIAEGISVTLSNVKYTRGVFTHEFCEGVIGYSVMLSMIGRF